MSNSNAKANGWDYFTDGASETLRGRVPVHVRYYPLHPTFSSSLVLALRRRTGEHGLQGEGQLSLRPLLIPVVELVKESSVFTPVPTNKQT